MSILDTWNGLDMPKKILSVVAVCILVFIVALIGGGGSPDKNTSDTTNGQVVTVKGNEFVLPEDAIILKEQNELVNFEVVGGVEGLLGVIYDERDLGGYINNDDDYLVQKIDDSPIEPQAYAFIDTLMDNRGYFIIFEKNDQLYVFEMYTDGATETGGTFSLEDEKTEIMAKRVHEFYNANSGLNPV